MKRVILLTLACYLFGGAPTFAQTRRVKKSVTTSAVDVASPYEYVGTLPPCPRTSLDGIEFSVKECRVVATIYEGDTDQTHQITVVSSSNSQYAYMISNTVVNFPQWSVYVDAGSGAVNGDLKFHITLLNRGFTSDGVHGKTYSGTLAITVFIGNSTSKQVKMDVPIVVTVLPKRTKG